VCFLFASCSTRQRGAAANFATYSLERVIVIVSIMAGEIRLQSTPFVRPDTPIWRRELSVRNNAYRSVMMRRRRRRRRRRETTMTTTMMMMMMVMVVVIV